MANVLSKLIFHNCNFIFLINAPLLLSSIQTSKELTRLRTNLLIHHQPLNSQHQLENLFTLSVILCRTKDRPLEWPNSQKGTLALCFPFRKMERRGFSRWWRRRTRETLHKKSCALHEWDRIFLINRQREAVETETT